MQAPPWVVLTIGVLLIGLLGILGLGIEKRLSPVTLEVEGTPSSRAKAMLEERFGESIGIAVLLKGPEEEIDRQGPRLVGAFREVADVDVLSPWEASEELATLRPEPTAAMVMVSFRASEEEASEKVLPLAKRIVEQEVEAPVESHISGLAVIAQAIEDASLEATHRAELIALPVLLLVLLLVFRSPFAALVPLMVGAATVFAGRGLLYLATYVTDINSLGVAIASMMGLALGIDYALLMVSRLRQERERGATMPDAVQTATRVGGRTIIFAGGTLILAMITATLVASGSLLASVAIGVVISGTLSVILATSVMPALLSAMGTGIERWHLPSLNLAGGRLGAPMRLISKPAVAVPLVVAVLLLMAAPAAGLSLGPPGVTQLPESHPVREDFEQIEQVVSPGWTAPYVVVATARDGVIGEPERLSELGRWQDRIARSDDVEAVIGPASLSRAEQAQERAKQGYESVPGRLGSARDGIERLRDGLALAREGVAELRRGLADGAAGADRLGDGAREARDGAAKLRAGLDQAAAGSAILARGLDRSVEGAGALADGNRRLAEGAEELARGFAQLDGALRTALAPMAALSGQLRDWSGWLRDLRRPTEIAAGELEQALRDLEAMAEAADDPLFPELRAAIERAYAMITGVVPEGVTVPELPDPITIGPSYPGSIPTESVRGIAPVLLAMQDQLADTAERLADSLDGFDDLLEGLDELAEGIDRLSAGARQAERGATRLEGGLGQLARGAHRLDEGLGELSDGAGELESGLGELAAGADELSEGLSDGYERSAELEDALGEADGPLAQYSTVLRGYEDGYHRFDSQVPGAIDSGYLVLTALDGTVPTIRDQIGQIVNLDRGGQSARMLIIPADGPSTPTTERVGEMIADEIPHLAHATGTDVEVGEGAQALSDYASATSSRLPWLMLALSIVAILTLILVVRSLVLPPIAVALTLLTIGSAFGGLELLYMLGVMTGPRYVDAISAAGILAIMFVLSIDYLVFLLTRMREGWLATGDHVEAIRYGLDNTASVITGAAAIMAAVFLAFAHADVASLKQFGAGLTIAVLIDATIVRLVLLPSIMHGLGPKAWWIPQWLDERLPNIEHVDPHAAALPDAADAVEADNGSTGASTAAGEADNGSTGASTAHAHDDHRRFVDLLGQIEAAGEEGRAEELGRLCRRLRRSATSHFEHERRELFPALSERIGSEQVDRVRSDQDNVLSVLERIESVAASGHVDPFEADEIKRLARAATAAVATCDGIVSLAESPDSRIS